MVGGSAGFSTVTLNVIHEDLQKSQILFENLKTSFQHNLLKNIFLISMNNMRFSL